MNRKEREERENLHFKYNPNHSSADGSDYKPLLL